MAIYKDYEMSEKTGSEFYSGFCDYQINETDDGYTVHANLPDGETSFGDFLSEQDAKDFANACDDLVREWKTQNGYEFDTNDEKCSKAIEKIVNKFGGFWW